VKEEFTCPWCGNNFHSGIDLEKHAKKHYEIRLEAIPVFA